MQLLQNAHQGAHAAADSATAAAEAKKRASAKSVGRNDQVGKQGENCSRAVTLGANSG